MIYVILFQFLAVTPFSAKVESKTREKCQSKEEKKRKQREREKS